MSLYVNTRCFCFLPGGITAEIFHGDQVRSWMILLRRALTYPGSRCRERRYCCSVYCADRRHSLWTGCWKVFQRINEYICTLPYIYHLGKLECKVHLWRKRKALTQLCCIEPDSSNFKITTKYMIWIHIISHNLIYTFFRWLSRRSLQMSF